MRNEEEYTDLIGKYLSGNISASESRELFAWVDANATNRTFFDQTVQVWNNAEQYEEKAFATDKSLAWSKIEHGIATANAPQAKVVKLQPRRSFLRVAVIALVLIGIGWWWSNGNAFAAEKEILIATQANETKDYTLPDGSIVALNEHSSIRFKENFKKRDIILEGEAFFDVERLEESPFEIVSGTAKTRVLGTSFNVRAYSQENLIEVTVESGTVEFSPANAPSEKVVLTKGNSGTLTKSSGKVQKIEKGFSNALTWKTTNFKFDNFQDVFLSIQRYYGVEIEVENEGLLDCDFTSTGSMQNLSLDVLKELIEFQTNNQIRLERQGNKYVLSGSCASKELQ